MEKALTERWKRVCKDAAAIWNGGACNPRALARELVEAIDVACEMEGRNGDWAGTEPSLAPAQMILAQLTFLLRTRFDALGSATAYRGATHWTEADMLRVCETRGGIE